MIDLFLKLVLVSMIPLRVWKHAEPKIGLTKGSWSTFEFGILITLTYIMIIEEIMSP